jgi:hypothetical protein
MWRKWLVLNICFFSKHRRSYLGSKKSGPIRLIKEACEQVEAFIGIPIAKSSLNNSGTMESVCVELQNRSHLFQVWFFFFLYFNN